jgi:hypothetical protein
MKSEPITIQSEAFYDDWSLSEALGLPLGTLAAARRAGALRCVQKGKRTLYRGSWVLAWLDSSATRKTASGEAVAP